MNIKFELNTKGTDFFVGDLHGEFTKFVDKLDEVNFNFETDRVFSVGDLIDRGEDSMNCLSLLVKPWFHCVLGNHEDFMLGSHRTHVWAMNGGSWAFDAQKEEPERYSYYKSLVSDLPLTMTVETKEGTVGVVHAESEWDWNDNNESSREKNTWARTIVRCHKGCTVSKIDNIDLVVVGHTPLKKVTSISNIVYIDTGACFGEELTMLTSSELFKFWNDNKPLVF